MDSNTIDRLRGGLIVSCQAAEDSPLHGPIFMAAMARAAEIGAAAGIRANGPADIEAIKQAVDLPVIGINKMRIPGYEPYITPTLQSARDVMEAGAEIIAVDATLRLHPGDLSSAELIAQIKTLGVPVMADISTLEEGIAAELAGADIVATTMSGYTPYSPQIDEPDFVLIEELASAVGIPVIAEGRIWTPEQARTALDRGAYAVVVGTAITRPQIVTERFVKAMRVANEAY